MSGNSTRSIISTAVKGVDQLRWSRRCPPWHAEKAISSSLQWLFVIFMLEDLARGLAMVRDGHEIVPTSRTRFNATTRLSAPLRRIGTFGLAVGATCAFFLGIVGQVLTFHTRAQLKLAPSTCWMPLGEYQP